MDTADSMQARGYGTGKRTQYTEFRMRLWDWILSVAAVVLFAVTMVSYAGGDMAVEYYPGFRMQWISAAKDAIRMLSGYCAYLMLGMLLPGYVLIKKRMEYKRGQR